MALQTRWNRSAACHVHRGPGAGSLILQMGVIGFAEMIGEVNHTHRAETFIRRVNLQYRAVMSPSLGHAFVI
jgi:hypothetical protein